MTQPALRMERRLIAGAGTDIHVSESGTGPLLILLHGIGSSGSSWMPVVRPLSTKYRLVQVDFRGHGKSGKPATGYVLDDYAADLEALIRHYTEPVRILGHSLGGLVAVTWAKSNPDTALGILLEDMPTLFNAERTPNLVAWGRLAALPVVEIEAHYRQEFPTWAETDFRRRAEMMHSTKQSVFLELRDLALKGNGIDLLEEARPIKSPIRLIYGDSELGGAVSRERGEAFADLGPKFSSVHIPGASHAIHRDSTDAFLVETFKFLDAL